MKFSIENFFSKYDQIRCPELIYSPEYNNDSAW